MVWLLLCAVLMAVYPPAPDASLSGLRIVARTTFPAGVRETTRYVGSDRVREEAGDYVQIRRCDLNRILMINSAQRTYMVAPLQFNLSAVERLVLSMGRPAREVPGAREVVFETTTVDTGERKNAFGHTARHVVITLREIPSGQSTAASETVTDGWYIDLDTRPSCERDPSTGARSVLIATASPAAGPTRLTFRDIGKPEEGFAIETTETSRWTADSASPGPPTVVTKTVVIEISRQALEPSVFDVPAGFRSTDGVFSTLAERVSRTAHVIHAVVASWFH